MNHSMFLKKTFACWFGEEEILWAGEQQENYFSEVNLTRAL